MTGPRSQGLLDTSVVITLDSISDESLLPHESFISAITLAELSVGPLVSDNELERARRQGHLQMAERDFDPIPFDSRAALAFGQVAASLRGSGRKPSAQAYDAMIAATALANSMPLYTRNAKDFVGIDGLEVVAVTNG